jgi:hypothetical protein
MSITDELRTEARGFGKYIYKSEQAHRLLAIADRIDAEHESACAEAYGNGVMSVPIALDESAWVELPKDADGECIHVGDVMEERSGHTFEVASLMAFGGSDNWIVLSDARNFSSFREPHDLRHYHAPTIEDVLTEFGIDWEHESDCEDRAALLKEYAAKLRLAGDGE